MKVFIESKMSHDLMTKAFAIARFTGLPLKSEMLRQKVDGETCYNVSTLPADLPLIYLKLRLTIN